MAGGIPHSVLATAFQRERRRPDWFCRVTADRPQERDVHVAAAVEECERLGVVVWHAEGRLTRPGVQASRSDPLLRRAGADRAARCGELAAEHAGPWDVGWR